MLVISKYALDGQKYHSSYTDRSWAKSSLRLWLNEDFFNEAFNEEEQKRILSVTITNDDNETYKLTAEI